MRERKKKRERKNKQTNERERKKERTNKQANERERDNCFKNFSISQNFEIKLSRSNISSQNLSC